MNPNPTIDNDLQKAIDDITNNTNNDPVFGDPVAAPAPMPTPAPEPMAPPMPKPATTFPEVGMPPAPKPMMDFKPNPAGTPLPTPAPFPPKPVAEPAPAPIPEPVKEPEAEVIEESIAAEETISEPAPSGLKTDILRDLAPMVKDLDMDAAKKFDLYKEIREDLHDDSVIASAYEVSKEITNDKERADALLYLYDSLK